MSISIRALRASQFCVAAALAVFIGACQSSALPPVPTAQPTPVPVKNKVLMILQEPSDDVDLMLDKEVGVMTAMLKKAGYEIVTASASGQPLAGKSMTLSPDKKLADVNVGDYAAVMVPCMGATMNKPRSPEAANIVKQAVALGLPVGAQASGVLILSDAGALNGKDYALFSEFDTLTQQRAAKGDGVLQDGNIITSGICPLLGKVLGRTDGTVALTEKMLALLGTKR